MNAQELTALLDRLRREPHETEWLEFKESLPDRARLRTGAAGDSPLGTPWTSPWFNKGNPWLNQEALGKAFSNPLHPNNLALGYFLRLLFPLNKAQTKPRKQRLAAQG
jgi:hypothetical protein